MKKINYLFNFFILVSPISLVACMATPSFSSSHGYLCEISEPNGWLDKERVVDKVHYNFDIKDLVGSTIAAPINDVHWVGVDAWTAGREVGWPAPPIVYDATEATLIVEGNKINALPGLWVKDSDSYKKISGPTDLNIKGKIIALFYIAFPVKMDDPKIKYIFKPGTILLNGVRYPLPVYKSCHEPGGFSWYPIT